MNKNINPRMENKIGKRGINRAQTSQPKGAAETPDLDINKKHHAQASSKSFETQLTELNAKQIPSIQYGAGGMSGTKINKYA